MVTFELLFLVEPLSCGHFEEGNGVMVGVSF